MDSTSKAKIRLAALKALFKPKQNSCQSNSSISTNQSISTNGLSITAQRNLMNALYKNIHERETSGYDQVKSSAPC